MNAKLPTFLNFQSATDLVRLGRDFDGGYLASQSDISNTDVLVSLGINDDWSFEEDFIAIKDVEVFAYDANMSEKHFFNYFKRSLRNLNSKFTLHWFKTWKNYKKFFSQKKVHHIKKFVGLNSSNELYCTVSSIFLKCDIEGWEYRFLDTLIKNQNRISGLVIEFHDFDIHLEKIKDFVKNFDLKIAHVHANNTVPVRSDDDLPLVMELTFSKYCKHLNNADLPHKLDMPTNKNIPEVNLVIKN